MESFCENITRRIVNFKLVRCCFVAPLRMGLLIIGYFNILISVILIIGTATDSFVPTIKHIQDQIMEEGSKSTCILVPTTELAFSVLLLCAMHRDDVILLRFYMRYAITAAGISMLIYSLVIAIVNILYIFVIVASILYQVYIVILVRSAIVDIKIRSRADKNGDVGNSSKRRHPKTVPDVEAPIEEIEVKTIEFKKMGDKKVVEKEVEEAQVEEKSDDKVNNCTADKSVIHKTCKTADKQVKAKTEDKKIDKENTQIKVESKEETTLEMIQETPKTTGKNV